MVASKSFWSGSHLDAGEQTVRFRWACLILLLVVVVMSAGFYRQAEWATSLWPWPDVRMIYIFVASIGASVAAPVAWAAWRNEHGALSIVALELMFGTPIAGGYVLWVGADWQDRDVILSGIGFMLLGAGAAFVFRLTRTIPLRNPRRLPAVFRGAFVVISGMLIVLGSVLAIQRPDVLPWDVSPETSTMIGIIFLSAALLFALVVARPMWAFGEMVLTAFIAYDIVLFIPYIDLLRNFDEPDTLSSYYGTTYTVASPASEVRESNLVIYLTVLAVSALLAIALYAWGAMVRHRERPVIEANQPV